MFPSSAASFNNYNRAKSSSPKLPVDPDGSTIYRDNVESREIDLPSKGGHNDNAPYDGTFREGRGSSVQFQFQTAA